MQYFTDANNNEKHDIIKSLWFYYHYRTDAANIWAILATCLRYGMVTDDICIIAVPLRNSLGYGYGYLTREIDEEWDARHTNRLIEWK